MKHFEWESPFYSNDREAKEAAMMNQIGDQFRATRETILQDQSLVAVSDPSEVLVTFSVSQALQNGPQWQEVIYYRGLILSRLEVGVLPDLKTPEELVYFVQGLFADESFTEPNTGAKIEHVVQRVSHFCQWLRENSTYSKVEAPFYMAHLLRTYLISLFHSPQRTALKDSVKVTLFKMLNEALYRDLLPQLRERMPVIDAQKNRTGDKMNEIMAPTVADIETLKAKIREWIEEVKSQGMGHFVEEIETFLSEITQSSDLESVKIQLLEMLRTSGHRWIKTHGNMEGFIEKVNADRDLLQQEEMSTEDIQP